MAHEFTVEPAPEAASLSIFNVFHPFFASSKAMLHPMIPEPIITASYCFAIHSLLIGVNPLICDYNEIKSCFMAVRVISPSLPPL